MQLDIFGQCNRDELRLIGTHFAIEITGKSVPINRNSISPLYLALFFKDAVSI